MKGLGCLTLRLGQGVTIIDIRLRFEKLGFSCQVLRLGVCIGLEFRVRLRVTIRLYIHKLSPPPIPLKYVLY